MPKHLSRMAIDKVSLVDKGANDRTIAVLKRQPMVSDPNAPAPEPEPGLLRRVAETLGLAVPEPVAKAEDFDGINAEHDLEAAIEDGFATLKSAVWGAKYAYHDDGTEYTMAEKAALAATSIDQFKAFIVDAMTVQKAGRKISGARLDQIKAAFATLGEVIEGVEAGWWTPPDGVVAKEVSMTPEEMQAAIEKAVADEVAKRLAPESETMTALSKSVVDGVVAAMPKPEPVEKAETPEPEKAEDDPDEVTLETVAEAVVELSKRLDARAVSTRQSAAGGDTAPEPVEKSGKYPLAGIIN